MLCPAVHFRKKAEDPREAKVEGIRVIGFSGWRISPGSHACKETSREAARDWKRRKTLRFSGTAAILLRAQCSPI
jgi:hypothetical protein